MIKIKGYQPIFVIENDIYLYKKDSIYKYNRKVNVIEEIIGFNSNFFRRLREKTKLTARILRTDIKSVEIIDENNILFFRDKFLYHFNIKEKNLDKIFEIREGYSSPLNICKTNINKNFISVFGEYGSNPKRKEVKIYSVNRDYNVECIYKFSANSIRHIHNIIEDRINNGYYIFSGDNEKEAGIYWSSKDFTEVEPILIGKQEFRVVAAYSTDKGLLYATDSVEEKNFIYLVKNPKTNPVSHKICKINGSSIYSTENALGYFFSTTVESIENKNNKLLNLFSMKLGKGILSDDIHLIYVSKNDFKAKIVNTYKKDRLPYKLFQYGVIKFPVGQEKNNYLVTYPNATRKHDRFTIIYEKNNLL